MCFLILLSLSNNLFCQEGYEVRKVRFKGNKTFSKEELLSNISIYQLGFIERLTKKKEPFFYNAEFVQRDLERLIRFYQANGFIYVKAKVDTANVDTEKRRVDIHFSIAEGKPILIDTVELKIEDKYSVNGDSLIEKLNRKPILKEGKRYEDLLLQQEMSDIFRAFQELGYAYATTTYELKVDTATNTASVKFTTKPGPLCYFGATKIEGNGNVDTNYILRRRHYYEGEVYDAEKIDKTRETLYDLQTFRIASVVPEFNYSQIEKPISVKIFIEEKPKTSAEIGIGYGTEDKFRTFLDLNLRNLLKDASYANLYFKHSALEPYHISLKLVQPQFLDKKTSLMINPYIRRQIEPGFDTQTLGVNIPINRKFNKDLSGTLTYYYERVTQNVEKGDYQVPDPENRKFRYNKSGLSASLTYSNALPRFSPLKGFTGIIGAKYNGYIFPGDFDFTKLWVDLRYYTLFGKYQFAVKAMAGGIITNDSVGFVPVEDRFYSGGANSIRGWARSQLGPKRASGSPLGGKSVVELGAELRRRIIWKLDVATFVDAGNVWNQTFHYPINEFVYSAGVGLRYETPIGPVRFDVSMPLWNVKKKPQFFISIGQAF